MPIQRSEGRRVLSSISLRSGQSDRQSTQGNEEDSSSEQNARRVPYHRFAPGQIVRQTRSQAHLEHLSPIMASQVLICPQQEVDSPHVQIIRKKDSAEPINKLHFMQMVQMDEFDLTEASQTFFDSQLPDAQRALSENVEKQHMVLPALRQNLKTLALEKVIPQIS